MAFSFGKSQPAPAAPAMSGGFNFGNAPMFVPPPTTTGSSAGFSFGTNSSQTQTVPPAPFSFSCSSPTFTFGAGFQQPKASTVADFDPLEHIVYNDELFISKPDRMYECSICLNTLRNATICTSCGNSFCHKCIVDCITRLHKCSVCGCELKSTTEGVVPNRTTRGVIENYMVKCFSTQKSHQSGGGAFYGTFAVGLPPPIKEDDKGSKANSGVPPPPTPTPAVSPSVNDKSESVIPPTSTATPSSSSLPSSSSSSSSSSPSSSFPSSSLPAEMCTEMCDWTGHLRDAESHYRHDCPFALVQCTFEGCSHISPRRDLSAHLSQCPFRKTSCQWCKKAFVFHSVPSHELVCEQRMVECPNGCCNDLSARNVEEHRLVCKKEVINCGFASAGCGVRLTRDAMAAHEQDAGAHVLLLFRELQLAQAKIVELEAKTEALQRDMNNVSVTTVPISTLRNSIFNICFAPAKVGNHTFSMTLQTSGGSGLQGGSFGGSNFIGRPPQVGPMHIHQLVANVTCSRYDGQLVSNDIYNGLTNAFYLIFSISVPDHPSIPTKSQKWKSFIISPNTRGGPSFNDECLGWLTTSIREIIASPVLEHRTYSGFSPPPIYVMFKVEWHLES